ncbi:MAG TPA: hypothetical protein VLM37_12285 [Fibrobacteraceae bacterium]|nr:hypothetical protein [Fibrobacteraceae bacterium]
MDKFCSCLSAFLLFGCTGSAPSIANFMASENIITESTQRIYGDLIREEASYSDIYTDETDANIDFGIYAGTSSRFGITLGSMGLSPTLGWRNQFLGVATWANLDITGNAFVTGGIALAQKYGFNERLMIGLYQYCSRNTINKWSNGELFRSAEGSTHFNELGLGAFLQIRLFDHMILSFEPKLGNQLHSDARRYYLTINIAYALPH